MKKKQRKEPFGRPTTYRPEYSIKMLEYFDRPLYIKKIVQQASGGRVVDVEIEKPNSMPTFEEFGKSINTAQKVMLEWEEKFSDFGKSYALCRQIQKMFLVEHGLNGGYNANFAKFMAVNCTDLRDTFKDAVDDLKHSLQLKYKIDGK